MPDAAFPFSLNVQACRNVDTFADEIAESGASRVSSKSAFG